MAEDAGDDESEELKRLLRRIEQADQQGRLFGAPSSDIAVAPEPGGPPANTGVRSRHLRELAALLAKPSKLGLAGKMAIAAVFAAVFATILVRAVPPISIVVIRGSINDPKSQGGDLAAGAVADPKSMPRLQPSATPPSAARNAADPEREKPPRSLPGIADQKVSGRRDQVVALPVHASAKGDGATWVVKGLVGGAKLSAGRRLDASAWELSDSELDGAVVIPPTGFVGTMNLTVERRGGDATVQQTVQVEWLEEPAAVVQQPTPVRLQPSEVARLLKRGQELLGSGNIVAARAVFKLLAVSGEPQGAFMLAETYEQSTLARLGAKGLDPDSAMARIWYQRAHELGSSEAQRRLDMLASKQK